MRDLDLFGVPVVNGHKSILAQTFDYPPFSVLNAREGWWQERKRAWLALGIKSEIGRGGDLIPNGAGAASKQRYDTGGGHGADGLRQPPRPAKLANAAPGGSARPTCGGYRKGGRSA